MNTLHPFKWRHFQSDIILLYVRWYLRYPLSYCNLEEMMRFEGTNGRLVRRCIVGCRLMPPKWTSDLCPHLRPTNDTGAGGRNLY